MEIDYKYIGKRISKRRRELGLKQSEVEERAFIGYKYLSNIERGISIPSIEVIIKLSLALNTTPDYFLLGSIEYNNEKEIVESLIKNLDSQKIEMAICFLKWLNES